MPEKDLTLEEYKTCYLKFLQCFKRDFCLRTMRQVYKVNKHKLGLNQVHDNKQLI